MRHEREYFRAVRAFLRAPEVPGVIAKKSYSAVRPPFTESTTRVPSGRSPLTTPDTFPSIERCFSPRRKSTILQANPFRTRHDLRARPSTQNRQVSRERSRLVTTANDYRLKYISDKQRNDFRSRTYLLRSLPYRSCKIVRKSNRRVSNGQQWKRRSCAKI